MRHFKDKSLIIICLQGKPDAASMAMISMLASTLQCQVGCFVEMDLGGLRILYGFAETMTDIQNEGIISSGLFTSRVERKMFRIMPLRFGLTMEQIETYFGYDILRTAITKMSRQEKEGMINFRDINILS